MKTNSALLSAIQEQIDLARPLLAEARELSRAGVSSSAIASALGVYLAPPPVTITHTIDDVRATRPTGMATCVACGRPFDERSLPASRIGRLQRSHK